MQIFPGPVGSREAFVLLLVFGGGGGPCHALIDLENYVALRSSG